MPNAHPRPWHRGSLFGDGPRKPLNREERSRFRFLVRTHRRAGRLTRAAEDVAESLVRRLGTDGQCDPAHATLAADAGCCDRTVRRALDSLHTLGLVRWTRRLIRAGWRVEQTSNAYQLALTENPAPVPAKCCGGHYDHQNVLHVLYEAVPAMNPAALEDAQHALAQRRAVIEARLAGSYRT